MATSQTQIVGISPGAIVFLVLGFFILKLMKGVMGAVALFGLLLFIEKNCSQCQTGTSVK